jgi:flagellar basal body-associated protein FliL
MAEKPEAEEKKPKSMLLVNVLVSSVLGFVCGGLGFALFASLPGMTKSADAGASEPKEAVPAFVPFGEVVVNLDEGRMSRYLRLNITLQVDESVVTDTTANVESTKAILRNWLLGYLSDLQMEDIRGAAGQNRIRREVQNHFNDILSPSGTDVVQDVLFEEFTIQ